MSYFYDECLFPNWFMSLLLLVNVTMFTEALLVTSKSVGATSRFSLECPKCYCDNSNALLALDIKQWSLTKDWSTKEISLRHLTFTDFHELSSFLIVND